MFVMARNKDFCKEVLNTMVCKMVTIRSLYLVNIDFLSEYLGNMNIDKLNIFYLEENTRFWSTRSNKHSDILYTECNFEEFKLYLNNNNNFLNYNSDSLYIIRGRGYSYIKNLFTSIENCKVNIGRGGPPRL